MNPYHPAQLGPITEPIHDAIIDELQALAAHPAYITHDDLEDSVVNATGCNPRTFESTLDRARRFGLAAGFKRIRLTETGRYWLDHHGASQ